MDNILALMDKYIKSEKVNLLEDIKTELEEKQVETSNSNYGFGKEDGFKESIKVINRHIENLKAD